MSLYTHANAEISTAMTSLCC